MANARETPHQLQATRTCRGLPAREDAAKMAATRRQLARGKRRWLSFKYKPYELLFRTMVSVGLRSLYRIPRQVMVLPNAEEIMKNSISSDQSQKRRMSAAQA